MTQEGGGGGAEPTPRDAGRGRSWGGGVTLRHAEMRGGFFSRRISPGFSPYAAFTPKASGRRASIQSQRIGAFQALVAWNASIR